MFNVPTFLPSLGWIGFYPNILNKYFVDLQLKTYFFGAGLVILELLWATFEMRIELVLVVRLLISLIYAPTDVSLSWNFIFGVKFIN